VFICQNNDYGVNSQNTPHNNSSYRKERKDLNYGFRLPDKSLIGDKLERILTMVHGVQG
jgi:hypothetical protein